MRIIKCKYLGQWAAITLGPFFILVHPKYIDNKKIINHERIHWMQQKRDWYIWFYIKYLYESITKGYRNISYEIEAYDNENDFNYQLKKKQNGM